MKTSILCKAATGCKTQLPRHSLHRFDQKIAQGAPLNVCTRNTRMIEENDRNIVEARESTTDAAIFQRNSRCSRNFKEAVSLQSPFHNFDSQTSL